MQILLTATKKLSWIALLLFTSSHLVAQVAQVAQAEHPEPKEDSRSGSDILVVRSTKIVETKHPWEEFRFDTSTTEQDSPFVINGWNKTDTITKLESLAGVPIGELERQLRPKESGSNSPLLGANESLLQRMALDNEIVKKHGLTHQQLAAPLLVFARLHKPELQQNCTIGFGLWFYSTGQSRVSMGNSPFLNRTQNKQQIHRMTIGRGFGNNIRESFDYSTRVAQTVFKYGFYGGAESPDRISPEKLIEFFSPRILGMVELSSDGQRKSSLKITSNRTSNQQLTVADLEFEKQTKDHGTEFVVNGSNRTELILELPKIAGKTIEELEEQMRPGALGERGSRKGFLGNDESPLDVLAADNRLVVEKHGLTHQQVAAPLLMLMQTHREKQSGLLRFGHNMYYVRRFAATNGFQHSPFGDDLKSCRELTVYHPQSKKSLHFSTLVPKMIYRYGFYEGLGTPYRVPPEKIIDFFGVELLKSIKLSTE